MKKWIVLLLIVAGGGYWAYDQWPDWKPKAEAAGSLAARPTTATVERRSIQFAVSAAGDIGPSEQVSVRPEVNGKIASLPVDLGDRVKKGDVLFTLDDTDLQTERSSRMTEIEGAKLQVERAERNFVRSKELFEGELISKELYEDTKTEYELAKNALDRSEKNLRIVEDRLSKTKIVAPFDCTVLTRPISMGQAVSGSGGFNSGTEVLTIADLNKMVINAHINQADVTRLNANQEVDIQVESVPGLTMKGTVERIAPQATIKNGIKGYAARIILSIVDPRVRPGMTANLTIPVASADNAVAVPLAAVFTEQGERFVYVQKDDAFEKRPVQIGIADYDFAEVLTGLNPGEVVSLEDKGQHGGDNHSGPRPTGLAGARPGGGANGASGGIKPAGSGTGPQQAGLSGGGGARPGVGGSNSTRSSGGSNVGR